MEPTTPITQSRALPDLTELAQLMALKAGTDSHDSVHELINRSLIAPLEDLFARPRKEFRARLVELSFQLSRDKRKLTSRDLKLVSECSAVLEGLHAGSLVVDDIQDGSRERRGKPSLHLRYGLPVALNAGNWLYFWPMLRIRSLGMKPDRELEIYRMCHDVLLRAHFGQALDVGTRIDEIEQERVFSVCMASMELKSGALMSLAMQLGGLVVGASAERLAALESFGHSFGIALQMFDDLGNFSAAKPALPLAYSKRFEDLYLRRPSWVWAVAASTYSSRDYQAFIQAVRRLPDESFLHPWIGIHKLIPEIRNGARNHLMRAVSELEAQIGKPVEEARALAETLARAYGGEQS